MTRQPTLIDYDKLVKESGVEFSHESKVIYNLLENTTQNIFLTGRPGTGKSTLLKVFRNNTSKNVVVLAPTGVAAVNVRGTTIHSYFKFPIHVLFPEEVDKIPKVKKANMIDMIIIDEISMVRADILDAIDITLRKTGKNPSLPFGGIQIVMVGDLYQIPPIVSENEKSAFGYLYKSPYFFSARCFKTSDFRMFELTKIYRQTDLKFINLLEKVRVNEVTDEDLKELNKSCLTKRGDEKFITLTTTKAAAKMMNDAKLAELTTESFEYYSTISGVFNKKNCIAEERLELKVGAQVRFIRNDNQKRWVNGTLGTVVNLADDFIEVEAYDSNTNKYNIYEVETVTWENVKYDWNQKTEKHEIVVIGAFTQYPLKLAYASTIHVAQGSTFDNIDLDLGWGAFSSGQTYVALSRCTSLEGIRLKKRIRHEDIILDPKIKGFFIYFEQKKAEQYAL